MSTRGFKFFLTENKLPRHLRAWTLDEVRRLRELAELGTAVPEIARQLKRTMCAVAGRAAKHGIVLPSSRSLRRQNQG